MSKAKVIVNKLLEGDIDDPHAYLNWLGQKFEVGELDKIRFGAHIHTSDEGVIRDNAREAGIDVDSQAFWDEVERCLAIMESNCLQLLREAGLHVSDEGHDETGARVASVWIDTDEEDRKLALLKAVINWAEGEWPSTTSGTMDYAFGANTTQRIYASTEDAARFIDVTIEFTGTDALVEWSRLNLNEAATGDPDDPEVFLKSYMPRMMGRVFIDFNAIKPHFPDAPANWVRDKVNGLDLFRYNRVTEMREVLRQMKSDYRRYGPNVPVDVITYRYKVPNPQGSSIVRGWLDKIGCPVPTIQWLCETNAPTWFFVTAKEFNAYMKMVYPQVKLESVTEGIDDPPTDLVNRLKPKVVCPKCGASAEIRLDSPTPKTHPTAPVQYDTDVPIARYLSPEDEADPNVSIHHFDIKYIYKCRKCGERFDGTTPRFAFENVDPDLPASDLLNHIHRKPQCPWCDSVNVEFYMKDEPQSDIWWCRDCQHAFDIEHKQAQRFTVESEDLDDPLSFIRRFKPRWKLFSHIQNGHFYFQDETGRVAVADYSMQNQRDPASSDDGLLLLDKTKTITRYRGIGGRKMWHIPVMQYPTGIGDKPIPSATGASEEEMADLRPKLEALGWTFQIREEDEDVDPLAYFNATTGWIDTFMHAGMTPDDSQGHSGQWYIKWRLEGCHFWIYVNVRRPLWLQVQVNDALYGRNYMQRTFEFNNTHKNTDQKELVQYFQLIYRTINNATKYDRNEPDIVQKLISKIEAYYTEFKQKKDRQRLGEAEIPAEDSPNLQHYLPHISPERCLHCNNDLTQPKQIERKFYNADSRLIAVLPGHYEASDSAYEPDLLVDRHTMDRFNSYPTFTDHCANCGTDTSQAIRHEESLDDPETYVRDLPVYTIEEIRDRMQDYGLSFYINHGHIGSDGFMPWGRWIVIKGFAYWAVNKKGQYLPASFFHEQLEKFCRDMKFTVHHIQLLNEPPVPIEFKLAIPKIHVNPDDYEAKQRHLDDPDYQEPAAVHREMHRDWLPEAEVPIPPEDEPQSVLRSHDAGNRINRELQSLDFKPQERESGFTWVSYKERGENYPEQIQETWVKGYRKNGKVAGGLFIRIYGGQKFEFMTEVFDAQKGKWRDDQGKAPPYFHLQSVGEYSKVLRDLDALMQKMVQEGLTADQQIVEIQKVATAYSKWHWDRMNQFVLNVNPQQESADEVLPLPPEDDPTDALKRFAKHTEQVEQEALDAAIDMAVGEFETRVRHGAVLRIKDADQLAAEIGDQFAQMAGYQNGSDEYDMIVSAVNNRASELFPSEPDDQFESANLDDPEHYLKTHVSVKDAETYNELRRYLNQWWKTGGDYPGWTYPTEIKIYNRTDGTEEFELRGYTTIDAPNMRRLIPFRTYASDMDREFIHKENPTAEQLDSSRFIYEFDREQQRILKEHPGMTAHLKVQEAADPDNLNPPPEDDDVDPKAYLMSLPQRLPNYVKVSSKEEAERLAIEAYQKAKGRVYQVSYVMGWRENDTVEIHGNFVVRVLPTDVEDDILRWHEQYLDPVWEVDVLDGPPEDMALLANTRSHYIDATSYTTGEFPSTNPVIENELDDPEYYLRYLTKTNLSSVYADHGLQSNDKGDYGYGQMEVDRPATMLWHGKQHEIAKIGLAIHTHPFQSWASVSVYIRPISTSDDYRRFKDLKFRYWTVPLNKLGQVVSSMINEIEGVCLVNDPTWPEMIEQFKAAMKKFRPYAPMTARKKLAESVPEPPPEDDPTDVIKQHTQSLLPAELKRLDFGPKPEHNKEVLYGVELPRYWWNSYQATDGKIHGLSLYFFGGQTPEVRANNWNFDAKAWFQRGNEAPTAIPAQSEAHLCAIIRDLDDAMKRSAADSLSPEQEHEAINNVLKHHRKWWDDTLDYLINTKGGTVPGRIGPGQPA